MTTPFTEFLADSTDLHNEELCESFYEIPEAAIAGLDPENKADKATASKILKLLREQCDAQVPVPSGTRGKAVDILKRLREDKTLIVPEREKAATTVPERHVTIGGVQLGPERRPKGYTDEEEGAGDAEDETTLRTFPTDPYRVPTLQAKVLSAITGGIRIRTPGDAAAVPLVDLTVPETVVLGPSVLTGIERLAPKHFQHVKRVARGSFQQLVALNAATLGPNRKRNLKEMEHIAFNLDSNVEQLGYQGALGLESTENSVRRLAAIFEICHGESWEAASEIELLSSNSMLPLPDAVRKNMRRANEHSRHRSNLNDKKKKETD